MDVTVWSFGYLHGPPPEADVVVDLRRVLHNPVPDSELRELTGADGPVRDWVAATPGAPRLAQDVHRLVVGLLVLETAGGVSVAFGCAGGRHRSVVFADDLARHLAAERWGAVVTTVRHRDVDRPVVEPGEAGPPVSYQDSGGALDLAALAAKAEAAGVPGMVTVDWDPAKATVVRLDPDDLDPYRPWHP